MTQTLAMTDPRLLAALRRGDKAALKRAMPANEQGLDALLDLLLEHRRQNVAVLGDYEAFTRRTAAGQLQQVIRPVRLSLHDHTLYQIPVRRPFKAGTNEPAPRNWRGDVEWRNAEEHVARLSYEGLNRLNGVAGCQIGMPDGVTVDGERQLNPYVQRAEGRRGRPGEILRVVIRVVVVGQAPATGNLVTVTYTLDYEPVQDLIHALAGIVDSAYGKGQNNDQAPRDVGVRLVPEELAERMLGEQKYETWHFLASGSGVGYLCDLSRKAVADAFKAHVTTQQHAVKKALTVARRNAMRAHPALAFSVVNVDEQGECRLGVVGWTAEGDAQRQWADLTARLARGQAVAEIEDFAGVDAQSVELTERYEAERYEAEEHAIDVPLDESAPLDLPDEQPKVDPRDTLRRRIEDGLELANDDDLYRDYDPEADEATLAALLSRINAELDRQG